MSAVDRFVGVTDRDYAAAAGIPRAVAYRVLEAAVREGEIVAIECGQQRLYARLSGGQITTAETAPTHRPGRQPADRRRGRRKS